MRLHGCSRRNRAVYCADAALIRCGAAVAGGCARSGVPRQRGRGCMCTNCGRRSRPTERRRLAPPRALPLCGAVAAACAEQGRMANARIHVALDRLAPRDARTAGAARAPHPSALSATRSRRRLPLRVPHCRARASQLSKAPWRPLGRAACSLLRLRRPFRATIRSTASLCTTRTTTCCRCTTTAAWVRARRRGCGAVRSRASVARAQCGPTRGCDRAMRLRPRRVGSVWDPARPRATAASCALPLRRPA